MASVNAVVTTDTLWPHEESGAQSVMARLARSCRRVSGNMRVHPFLRLVDGVGLPTDLPLGDRGFREQTRARRPVGNDHAVSPYRSIPLPHHRRTPGSLGIGLNA